MKKISNAGIHDAGSHEIQCGNKLAYLDDSTIVKITAV
jgi:hypothetical protein